MDRHGQEPEDECRFVPGKPLLAKTEAEQPELDAGAEEGNREKHERDADQAQDDLGRAGSAIPGIAAVVTEKPVADAPQLEKHRRHEQKADQRVREQARADPGEDLGGKRDQQHHGGVPGEARIGLDAGVVPRPFAEIATGPDADQCRRHDDKQRDDQQFHLADLSATRCQA